MSFFFGLRDFSQQPFYTESAGIQLTTRTEVKTGSLEIEQVFGELNRGLIKFKKNLDSLSTSDSKTITSYLSKEELIDLSEKAKVTLENLTSLTKLREGLDYQISFLYESQMEKDVRIVYQINRSPSIGRLENKLFNCVYDDINAKKKNADNNGDGAFKDQQITITTKNTSNTEAGGYQVWYADQIDYENHDSTGFHPFPKFSSPTTTPAPPGYYYFWTENLRTHHKSHGQKHNTANGTQKFEADVSTDE